MITSSSNGRIKYIMTLMQKSKFRKKEGRFIIEGTRIFEEAPIADIEEVYVNEASFDSFSKEVKDKLKKVRYELVTESVFKKISDTVTPQGILCVMKINSSDISNLIKDDKALVIILENIQDPGNLGTIVRTSEGAGVTGIIMSEDCVDLYNPKVIRSTMGSIFRQKICFVSDVKEALAECKKKDIHSYACALDKKAKEYTEFDFIKKSAIVIGNEGNGLKEETIKACDDTCFIPMCGEVESLNASMAAGIMMYEALRQRKISAKK